MKNVKDLRLVDKNKIFGLFDDSEDESRKNISSKDINNFKTSPIGRIGMFTKIISNHDVFHRKLEKFLKSEDADFDVDKISQVSEPTVYNRAWFYIKGIDPLNSKHIEAINTFTPSKLLISLDSAILFFELKEEYEKCALLLKIKDQVKVF
jgi:hypothetical protein